MKLRNTILSVIVLSGISAVALADPANVAINVDNYYVFTNQQVNAHAHYRVAIHNSTATPATEAIHIGLLSPEGSRYTSTFDETVTVPANGDFIKEYDLTLPVTYGSSGQYRVTGVVNVNDQHVENYGWVTVQ